MAAIGVASHLDEGRHQLRRGELGAARATFAQAASTATRSGDGAALVEAAIGIGGLWVYEQRDVVERAALEDLWRRAAATAVPGSLPAARLAVRLAAEAVYEGRYGADDDPVGAVADAAEAVRRFGDDAATAEALSLLHHCRLGPAEAGNRLPLADEIVRLAVRGGDDVRTVQGLAWRTIDLYLLGDTRARQSHQELRERADVLGCEALAFVTDVLDAMVAARAGRLDEAEGLATAAVARGVAAGDPDALAYYGAMVAALRWWQGRPAEILDVVRAASASPRLGRNDHVYVAADALLSALAGDSDAADEAVARLVAEGLDDLPPGSAWLTTLALLGEAAFRVGDEATAAAVHRLVLPFAELPVLPSLAVVCLGSAWRVVGLTAAVTGDIDAAVEHLERAILVDRRLGSRPMAVLTEHDLAALLRRRGREGDTERAEALVARAASRAGAMGMAPAPPPAWLDAPPPDARSSVAPSRTARLERVGTGWRIDVGARGSATVLADRVGLRQVATLLACPGQDVDVLDLAVEAAVGPVGRAAPVLDERALTAYRRRVAELREDVAAGPAPDEAAEELRALTAELAAATGLGGRSRRFTDEPERARTSVRKAIVRAIAAIADIEPAFGDHLRHSITTGATCRYEPGDGWAVSVRR